MTVGVSAYARAQLEDAMGWDKTVDEGHTSYRTGAAATTVAAGLTGIGKSAAVLAEQQTAKLSQKLAGKANTKAIAPKDETPVHPWSNPTVRNAAKNLEGGATEVTVDKREEAEELFVGLFQGEGYENATGLSPDETKKLKGGKGGTYHWDEILDDEGRVTGHGGDNTHGDLPHLQIHPKQGKVIRIFYEP